METQSFNDYLYSKYNIANSRTAPSYSKAITILDNIFAQEDVFNLNGIALSELRDPLLVARIIEFIDDEEAKFRKGEESIFKYGKSTQKSYPLKRFCTGAIHQLGEFVNLLCQQEATVMLTKYNGDGVKLAKKLKAMYKINDRGTETEIQAKHRIGQDMFRAMLLKIYDTKCCLTGIDVAEVLRASHIIPWAENKEARLNPENGLCLSATYDAAFDRNLISFDEDYRMILSPALKEEYTSEAFNKYFRQLEGRRIELPSLYKPSQDFLSKHRERLIS